MRVATRRAAHGASLAWLLLVVRCSGRSTLPTSRVLRSSPVVSNSSHRRLSIFEHNAPQFNQDETPLEEETPGHQALQVVNDHKPGEVLGIGGESSLLLRVLSRGSKGLFQFDPDPSASSGHAVTTVAIGQSTACVLLPFVSTPEERTGERLNCVIDPLNALDIDHYGLSYEPVVDLPIVVYPWGENNDGINFGTLPFSVAATPTLRGIDEPAIEPATLLQLRGRYILGDEASIRLFRRVVPTSLAGNVLKTAGGNEQRLVCPKRDAEGQLFTVEKPDSADRYEGRTGCKMAPLPVGQTAGPWPARALRKKTHHGVCTARVSQVHGTSPSFRWPATEVARSGATRCGARLTLRTAPRSTTSRFSRGSSR
jgi:hypothetical protein